MRNKMENERRNSMENVINKMSKNNRFLFYILAKEKISLSNLLRQSSFNVGITGNPDNKLIQAMHTWIDIMKEFNFLDDFLKLYPEDKDGINELIRRYPKDTHERHATTTTEDSHSS